MELNFQMASLRKEALKRFCCSICNKKYRYEPPYNKHMAKHALEKDGPSSSELDSLSSQLVDYQKETSQKFETLMTVVAELQVALAAETEKRVKLELLIKSRGLRSSGLDWKEMFTLASLEAGMEIYFNSCLPHIAYDSTATKGLDILWTFFQMLQYSWNSAVNPEGHDHELQLWVYGSVETFTAWELSDLVVPHLLEVLPSKPSYWASRSPLIVTSHVTEVFTALRGYMLSSGKYNQVKFRGMDRPSAVSLVVSSTIGVKQWKDSFKQ